MGNGAGEQRTRGKPARSSRFPRMAPALYLPAIGSSARKSLSVTPMHGGGRRALRELGASVRGRGGDSRPHTAGWEGDADE